MKPRLKPSVLMAGRMKGWPLFRQQSGPRRWSTDGRPSKEVVVTLFHSLLWDIFKICVTGLTEAERPILEFIYPYMIFILADETPNLVGI